jgi:hypothetical protein
MGTSYNMLSTTSVKKKLIMEKQKQKKKIKI